MRYTAEVLKNFGMSVMMKAGLNNKEASLFIESLLFADLRGIGSHGISRLRTYAKRVETGVVAKDAQPEILTDKGAALSIDGKNGIGSIIALQVMDLCINRAKQYGCCFATVKNGNHFGTGAFYTEYAAKREMAGFIVSNSEAAVVPIGGIKAMLGTNPLSAAVPAKKYPPFVMDMATSVVARGKVILAQKENREIPEGWCIDAAGRSTTDPAEALKGAMLPFGGPKGYAISFLIDILCSALGGALDCRKTHKFWTDFEHPQNVGYFMGAIDISAFTKKEDFYNRMDSMIQEFKECPTTPGVEEVMIPGEIEHQQEEKNGREGIELSKQVIQDLILVAEQYQVPHPF